MALEVELFWSYRSPFSYLAIGRIAQMAAYYDLAVKVRPVYPLAVRTPDFFKNTNRTKLMYLVRDCHRVAEYLDIPFVWPHPDPVDMDMTTMAIAPDQPLIKRLMHLGIAAGRAGHGLQFTDSVARLIWNGQVRGWDQGDHLKGAVAAAGLELAALEAEIVGHEDDIEEEIDANHAALEAAGHWGVPTLVFNHEPFFGQDRIDVCLWTLKKAGLRERG